MEKQEQNIRSWDDLIFENRNKAYGAYAIRQDYSNGLLKGLLLSIGFAAVILVSAGLLSETKIIGEVTKTLPDIPIGPVPNVLQDKPPVQPSSTPVRQVNHNFTPVAAVAPDTVEQDPKPAIISTGTEGTTDGTATPDSGTSGGVNTGTDLGTVPVKDNKPFLHAEVMPEYKGGLKGMIRTLERNMRYPASARRMGKEGVVFVEFVVSDEGDVVDVKVIKGFDLDCDKEAIRMVEKLTEWTPGLQNKLAVNVKMVLPIKFQIQPQ